MGGFILFLFLIVFSIPTSSHSQERRKILISNATLSYSALPLVAARQWKLFQEQGMQVAIDQINAQGGVPIKVGNATSSAR